MENKPLTESGGRFEQVPEAKKVLCLIASEKRNSGILYVQNEANPYVIALKSRLAANDFNFQIRVVSSQEITNLYSIETKKSTSTQLTAKELFALGADVKASDIHILCTKSEGTNFKIRVLGDLVDIPAMTCNFEDGYQLQSSIFQSLSKDHSKTTFEEGAFLGSRIQDKEILPNSVDSIRVATGPLTDGLMMVLRLQYKDTEGQTLSELGVPDLQLKSLVFLQNIPTGIVIVTGPTGAGKTTTLKVLMDSIIASTKGKKHILTVEDPAEYPINGANQLKVNTSQDDESRAYHVAAKGSLRLDPDVILFGEIRDNETANQGFKAAMTGHKVYTSLHANNALGALWRLLDLGIPNYFVTDPSILRGITAQRLVKTLCPHCKEKYLDVESSIPLDKRNRLFSVIMDPDELDKVYVANDEGCSECRNGYIGRTLVIEVLVTDQMLMQFVKKNQMIEALNYLQGKKGFKTMLDVAIDKIKSGEVDPFEVEQHVGPLNLQILEKDHHLDSDELRKA